MTLELLRSRQPNSATPQGWYSYLDVCLRAAGLTAEGLSSRRSIVAYKPRRASLEGLAVVPSRRVVFVPLETEQKAGVAGTAAEPRLFVAGNRRCRRGALSGLIHN